MGAEEVPCLEGKIPDKRSFYKGICVIDWLLKCIDSLRLFLLQCPWTYVEVYRWD